MKPMRSAGIGLTKPDAGVIATRPATAPEIADLLDGMLAQENDRSACSPRHRP